MIFRRGCLAREKAPQKVRKTICFLIDIDKVCKTRSLQVNYISLVFGWQKKTSTLYRIFFYRPANFCWRTWLTWQSSNRKVRMTPCQVVKVSKCGCSDDFLEIQGAKNTGVFSGFLQEMTGLLKGCWGKTWHCGSTMLRWVWVETLIVGWCEEIGFSGKGASCTSNTNLICTPLEETVHIFQVGWLKRQLAS